jgi:hypothetical protein
VRRSNASPAIRVSPQRTTEHHAERVALWWGEPVEPIQERSTQLVEPGEREPHLRLDSGRPGDATLRGLSRHVVQKRRLADAGVAPEHENMASTRPDLGEHPVQPIALAAAPEQGGPVGLTPVHGHRRRRSTEQQSSEATAGRGCHDPSGGPALSDESGSSMTGADRRACVDDPPPNALPATLTQGHSTSLPTAETSRTSAAISTGVSATGSRTIWPGPDQIMLTRSDSSGSG